jgi:hypothetical protein
MTPRGIEILVKKASVDGAFRRHLLAERSGAAERIGLELDPAEAAMLDAIPETQLVAIIEKTRVAPLLRPAFLGYAAAAMLAAVGGMVGCGYDETETETETNEPKYDILNEEPNPELLYGQVTGIRPGMFVGAQSLDTTALIIAKLHIRDVVGPGEEDPNRYAEELSLIIEPFMDDLLVVYYNNLNEYRELSKVKIPFSFCIGEDGEVFNIRLMKEFYKEGDRELVAETVRSVQEWHFPPAGGMVVVECEFDFRNGYR